MFETNDRKALREDQFEDWLAKGRTSKLGYHLMAICWNEWEQAYRPVFFEDKKVLSEFRTELQESVGAVYDIDSESIIS
jgi:hypothetical protein